MRTPKYIKLVELIIWLNKNYNSNITILSLDTSLISSNSWLSGFIDADGSFNIRHSQINDRFTTRVYMRLTQSKLDSPPL